MRRVKQRFDPAGACNPGRVRRGDLMTAFDTHRPPEQSVLDDCVHCGFCLDACPTYALWAQEADSPRGRIVLIDEALNGTGGLSDEMVSHFDSCLGCMACVTACPSGVRYDRLIERVRPQIERHHERATGDRALRLLLFETLPHPKRLRAPRAATSSGPASSASNGSPGRLSMLAKMAPRTSPDALAAARAEVPERTPAVGEQRGRVALLLGCVQRVFYPQVHIATIRALAAEGFEVARASGTGLLWRAGTARRRRGGGYRTRRCDRRGVRRPRSTRPHRRQRRWVRRGDEGLRGAARTPAAHAFRPACATSPSCSPRSSRGRRGDASSCRWPTTTRATCNTRSGCARSRGRCFTRSRDSSCSRSAPSRELCCGSAGIYNLVQPEAAAQLGERKARHLIDTGAQAIAAGIRAARRSSISTSVSSATSSRSTTRSSCCGSRSRRRAGAPMAATGRVDSRRCRGDRRGGDRGCGGSSASSSSPAATSATSATGPTSTARPARRRRPARQPRARRRSRRRRRPRRTPRRCRPPRRPRRPGRPRRRRD